MHELITKLTERAGISEEQAHKAVETIKDFVKDKFPMVAGAVDNIFPSGSSANTTTAAAEVPGVPADNTSSSSILDKISDLIPGEMGEKVESFAKDKLGGLMGGK